MTEITMDDLKKARKELIELGLYFNKISIDKGMYYEPEAEE